MATWLDDSTDREERACDDMLRAHDQMLRTYRRFLCAIVVAFAGVASTVAKRLVGNDENNESIGIVMVLSLATVLGALEARDGRHLHRRMRLLGRQLR